MAHIRRSYDLWPKQKTLAGITQNHIDACRVSLYYTVQNIDFNGFLILFLAKSFVNDKQIYIAALHINQILCNHINDKNQNSVLNSLSPP